MRRRGLSVIVIAILGLALGFAVADAEARQRREMRSAKKAAPRPAGRRAAPRICDGNTCANCTKGKRPQGDRSGFISSCTSRGVSRKTCTEMTRPNPLEEARFACTYGKSAPHELVPPKTKWDQAIKLAKVYESLRAQGVCTDEVYNWWRPEPYNRNVEGAKARHPNATCIDVRFCSVADAKKALRALCKLRSQGKITSVGYYGATGVHIGMDPQDGSWGGACP